MIWSEELAKDVAEWKSILARVEAGGNDLADVYDAQEYSRYMIDKWGTETAAEYFK